MKDDSHIWRFVSIGVVGLVVGYYLGDIISAVMHG